MEVDLTVLDPPDTSSPMSSPELAFASSSASTLSTSSSSLFGSGPVSARGDFDPSYPTIRFEGSSKGVHSGTSKIRGTVQMMRDGTVRWNFVSTVLVFPSIFSSFLALFPLPLLTRFHLPHFYVHC